MQLLFAYSLFETSLSAPHSDPPLRTTGFSLLITDLDVLHRLTKGKLNIQLQLSTGVSLEENDLQDLSAFPTEVSQTGTFHSPWME